jgi:hypothetical protein
MKEEDLPKQTGLKPKDMRFTEYVKSRKSLIRCECFHPRSAQCKTFEEAFIKSIKNAREHGK